MKIPQSRCLVAAVALQASTAAAFRDTSPFFAYSSSNLSHIPDFSSPPSASSPRQLSSHVSILEDTLQYLLPTKGRCLDDHVIIHVHQSDVRSTDFTADSAPHLYHALSGQRPSHGLGEQIEAVFGVYHDAAPFSKIKSSMVIPEVKGDMLLGMRQLFEPLASEACSSQDIDFSSVRNSMTAIKSGYYYAELGAPATAADVREAIQQCDQMIRDLVSEITAKDFTVIVTTAPPRRNEEHDSVVVLPPSDHSAADLHSDLRRSLSHEKHLSQHRPKRQEADASSLSALASLNNTNAPLFERYNYLSPGIYMGLLAAVLLLTILYVGLTALSSLEITHAAFSKEMGPQGSAGRMMKGQQ